MATAINRNSNGSQEWTGLTASENGDALILPKGGGLLAVAARDGGGSGFNTGTITIQGTVDGTNWFTLLTGPGGSEVTFTADGYAEVTTACRAVRPNADGSISDVDIAISVIGE